MASRVSQQKNRGHIVVQATLGVIVLCLAGWGTATSLESMYPSTATSSAAVKDAQQRPDEGDEAQTDAHQQQATAAISVMASIGFSPDLLAVIGVTPAELAALKSQASDSAASDLTAVRTQSGAVSTARKSLAGKERELQQATDDASRASLRTQIATLRDQIAAAQAQLASTKTELRARYRGWLQAEEQERLDVVNLKPTMQVPLYYAVVSRSEADWVRLRDALAAQKHAVRKSIELDTTTTAYLATVDADSNVQAAKARWEANAAQLRGMWR